MEINLGDFDAAIYEEINYHHITGLEEKRRLFCNRSVKTAKNSHENNDPRRTWHLFFSIQHITNAKWSGVRCGVARFYFSKPNIPIWVNFGVPCNQRCW
jgi:hypothetical protein